MKKLMISLFLISALGTTSVFAACSKPTFTTAEKRAIDPKRINDDLLDNAILKLVNYNRCRSGRGPMVNDSSLQKMAKMHSESMAKKNFFSHSSPVSGQRKMKHRARKAGVKYRALGENIASQPSYVVLGRMIMERGGCKFVYLDTRKSVPAHSYASLAQTAMAGWMGSKGHKKNLLSRKFKRTSTVARLNPKNKFCGNYVLTQNFAN